MRSSAAAEATVGAAGSAEVTLGPSGAWASWSIVAVSVTLSTGPGEARIYSGHVSAASFIEGTYSGDRDTSTWPAGSLVLDAGERLVIRWTGATPGATATAVVRYQGAN